MDATLAAPWLLPAGALIATLSMALGIGGGILWAPLLILGYGVAPRDAVATSLAIQMVGTFSGSVAFAARGLLDRRYVLALAAAAAPAVFAGGQLGLRLPERGVRLALGVMALALALAFVAERERARAVTPASPRPLLPLAAALGLLMGLLSVGLGEWLVPLLRSRVGLEMRRAVATIAAVMFVLACVGSVSYAVSARAVSWELFVWAAPGVLLGGQLGPHLGGRISERALKEGFVFGMTLVGIHLVFHAL